MGGRVASWDMNLGYRLYLEGKTNQQIADACGTKLANVKAARLKHWKKSPDGGRNAPPDGAVTDSLLREKPLEEDLERKESANKKSSPK